MAYALFSKALRDRAGNVLASASVTVYVSGTTNLASLFSDVAGSSALDNPLTSDSGGEVVFYVVVGTYDLVVTKGRFSQTLESINIDSLPAADLSSVATGKGASLIGVEDAGGLYAAANVEAALAEIADRLATFWDDADEDMSVGGYDSLSTYAQAYIPDQTYRLADFIGVDRYPDVDGLNVWGASALRAVAEFTQNTDTLSLLPSAQFSVTFAHPADDGYLTKVRTRDCDFIKLGLGNVDEGANDWLYWQNDTDDIPAGHGGGEVTTGYWQNAWVQSNGGTLPNWHGWFADGYFSGGASTPTNGAIFHSTNFIQGSGVDFLRYGAKDDATDFLFKVDSAGTVRLKPAASVTPGVNGELVVQATSNTSLTFKFKGDDGVVRSGSITLS